MTDPARNAFSYEGEGNFDLWGCDVYAEWAYDALTFVAVGDLVLLGEGINRLRSREDDELTEAIWKRIECGPDEEDRVKGYDDE